MISKHLQSRFANLLLAACLGASAVLASGCAVVQKQESAGEYVEDSAITTSVKGRLLGQKDLRANGISVNTMKGQVQLSGYVPSAGEKAQAETIARGVKGVTSVRNDIIVRP